MASQPIRIKITGKGADEQDDFAPVEIQQGFGEDDFTPLKSASFETSKAPPTLRKNTLKGPKAEPSKSWTANDVVESLRPWISGAVGGAAGMAGAGVASVPMALGGYLASDLAIKNFQKGVLSDAPSELTGQDMADSAFDAGINEVGGRVISGGIKAGKGVLRGIKEYRNPGSLAGVTDDSIFNLQPTFSQAYRKIFGTDTTTGRVSKWVEDIFFAGEKAAAMENSATLARDQGYDMAAKISGRSAAEVRDPHTMARFIKGQAEANLDASYAESGRQATTAKLIAKSNTQTLPDGAVVEGPINIADTVKMAKQYMTEVEGQFRDIVGMPDPIKPLYAAASNIVKNAGAVFDPKTGALIGMRPISFEDAWKMKHTADTFGYGDPREAATHTSTLFKNISKSLNKDIDNSIGNWVVGMPQAKKAWNYAKATVRQRLELFGQNGVKQLLNTVDSPVPELDTILNDPTILQRALNSGTLKFPSGVVKVSNMADFMQGYQISKFLNSAWKGNTLNPARGVLKPDVIVKELYDAKNTQSYGKLFTSQNRANVDQFLTNVAHTSEKQIMEGSWIPRVGMWKGAVALSSALLGAGAFNLTPYQGGAVTLSAAVLTGVGVAKLLTNPKTARPLIALAAGQPAGVSDQWLSRAIMGALQGTYVTLIDANGKETQVQVNQGRFEPPDETQ